MLLNVLLQRVQIVMKNKVIRKKINIKKETKERISENYSRRKVFIQEKIVSHPIKMMIVTMIMIE